MKMLHLLCLPHLSSTSKSTTILNCIRSPVLEYKSMTNLGGMPSAWAQLKRGGAVVGSRGVVGLHVAFVASAAKVFFAT